MYRRRHRQLSQKALLAVGPPHTAPCRAPEHGSAKDKTDMLEAARLLHRGGLTIYANRRNMPVPERERNSGNPRLLAIAADMEPQARSATPSRRRHGGKHTQEPDRAELSNGRKIRRAAIDLNIPLLTNSRLASAFIHAFTTIPLEEIENQELGRILKPPLQNKATIASEHRAIKRHGALCLIGIFSLTLPT